ncbi:carboxypeptidase-like regulatory domain-containing protein [Hymenobacter sp. 5516J-16]|uniref:carboxypeptidase-like regulatory domain-containing protein n=1 Tax=Hymenobacter sp. 5516J-16 TaxID=2932253 RepID=UPI001FD30B69|nr:carboxypeptidase-like regulatory domain-containing protein [Hymenobacter sp. 5516J-16]UOQ75730.1 carboxypeptidase-like regulatory domain-containing protein [Hymenobacter sp. 5516J-16]
MLLPALSFAQENKISGRVVDEKTKEPIPFASIGLKEEQTGALTNEYGYFQIAMPEKNPQDSLVVVALGYFHKAVLVKPGIKIQDMIIEVPKRAIELKEVKVISSAKIKNLDLGSKSNTPGEGMIQGMPGSQYAFFVKNDKAKKLGNVRSVSFYIGENGFPASLSASVFIRPTVTTTRPTPTCSRKTLWFRLPKAASGILST